MVKKLVLDDTKIMYHKDRLKSWLEGEKVAPITIEWALSKKCTYRCVFDNYCYTKEDRTQEDVITKKVAYDFLDDAAKAGVKAVPLGSDGESTCNPIVYDVISYTKELGLDTALATNGYTLNDSKLDKILPELSYLKFNISSANPDMYSHIMGCDKKCFYKVSDTIKKCVQIKKENGLDVTIGLQMVLMPKYHTEILPLTEFGRNIGVDYMLIKHCAENREASLGINYDDYEKIFPTLKKAEEYETDTYKVIVKWSKMIKPKDRIYKYCFGPIFLQQMSSSGDIGPCGTFFDESTKWYNLGNISKNRYKDILQSNHYWDVITHLSSNEFDNTSCWNVCFQHKVNEFLWNLKENHIDLDAIKLDCDSPMHINFI